MQLQLIERYVTLLQRGFSGTRERFAPEVELTNAAGRVFNALDELPVSGVFVDNVDSNSFDATNLRGIRLSEIINPVDLARLREELVKEGININGPFIDNEMIREQYAARRERELSGETFRDGEAIFPFNNIFFRSVN